MGRTMLFWLCISLYFLECYSKLPEGVTTDPCASHKPTADNSLGCMWGPEGDELKVSLWKSEGVTCLRAC